MNATKIAMLALAVGCSCATTKMETKTADQAPAELREAGVTSEQFEAIDDVFKRKTAQLHDCWQEEFARTNDRNLQGDLTIGLVVQTSGKASEVKIVKSTIASPQLQACVVKEVSNWSFPEVQVPAPFSRMVHMGSEF